MQLNEIIVDQTLRELTPRGTPLFPIEMYENDMSCFVTRSVPWHWHREVELVYVRQGQMLLESNGSKITLPAGCGAFINSQQLHAMRPLPQTPCTMTNIVFDPLLVSGSPHSIFAQKYVLPVTSGSHIMAVPLSPEAPWQADVLLLMQECFTCYAQAAIGHEILLRNYISQIWLSVFEHLISATKPSNPQDPRLKQMLTFLHENYALSLTIYDIANSAGISVRTCCRCFQQQLGITAFDYLLEFRIKTAAQKLLTTQDSITEICFQTGFNDTSYFTRVFRRTTGYTPTALRKSQEGLRTPSLHFPSF